MDTTEILVGVIIFLIGIIGGSSVQTMLRKGNILPDSVTSASSAAASAASAAASAAAVTVAFREEVSGHMANLEAVLREQNDTLRTIQIEQASQSSSMAGFTVVCKAKHDAIDKEQRRIDLEINTLRAK